ncbi:MAG TPA: aminodeoxychorismate synthase component I [Steroidobacteraceae bacterium]|nr:aminodeoxychorismate synthase component I [Steroidobacteraceae bacterium]
MPAIITPVAISNADTLLALHALNPSRYPFLLESAAQSDALGSFDILMAFPGRRLALRESNCDFLGELDRWWLQERIESESTLSLPFYGGWFLFLGYELAGQIEPSLSLPPDSNVDTALAVRIPAALVQRHSDGQAWIVCEENSADLAAALQADLSAVHAGSAKEQASDLLASPLAEEAPEKYLSAVRRALEHIAAGDIYQANLSRGWKAPLKAGVTPDKVYRRLRRANPAPFAALAELGDRAILSSSPERLLSVRNGIAATRPIAGTRPRRGDRIDDAERLRELSAHPKERAEHVMLIDLERNDLGRICLPGTVEVDEFMTLESYAHVHHIVSNVRGRMRPDVTPGQAIAALFPGGTITGCPKIRCMQIIADTEGVPRGAYTGSMGYLNRDGSMDLNILIRTLELRDGEVVFRAGAGIVADSVPERELDETRAKARGLVRAFEQATPP